MPERPHKALNTEDRRLLRQGAHAFGVELTENQLSLFALFLQGLWSWGRRLNLTGLPAKRDIIIKLLLDPLVALPYLPSAGTVLDIGSGAGIPGLPFKIARHAFEVHLLESRAKKVSFLKDMIRKLDLKGIEACQGRAEYRSDPATLFTVYDMVTARALAPLKKTIGLCLPFVKPEGLLITFKGSRVNQEIEESGSTIEETGLNIKEMVPYALPETTGGRHLVILQKKA